MPVLLPSSGKKHPNLLYPLYKALQLSICQTFIFNIYANLDDTAVGFRLYSSHLSSSDVLLVGISGGRKLQNSDLLWLQVG
jgi:hypothetical protein